MVLKSDPIENSNETAKKLLTNLLGEGSVLEIKINSLQSGGKLLLVQLSKQKVMDHIQSQGLNGMNDFYENVEKHINKGFNTDYSTVCPCNSSSEDYSFKIYVGRMKEDKNSL